MGNNIIFYQNFFPEWVMAGTTTRGFGDLKNLANQNKLAKILGIANNSLYCLKQKHTVVIREIGMDSRFPLQGKRGKDKEEKIGDGLLTRRKNICLLVKTADCVPVLIVEKKKKLIMVLHAGRVGLQKHIVDCGLKEILKRGGDAGNVRILLGPFIEKKCYRLDLESMVKVQLLKNGVEDSQISSYRACTYCNNHEYFSHRHGNEERMATFIKMI